MRIGTKSILFGAHQFAIHPWFVAWGWWKLYGFPWDPRLWVAFFVHDLGYFGKPNMDGEEGELHPYLGAKIVHTLFDSRTWAGKKTTRWYRLCLFHSRFLAKKMVSQYSALCVADKMAIALTPAWIYLPLVRLTGELEEYMSGQGARTPAGNRSPEEWYSDVQLYCKAWAIEHKEIKEDRWTNSKRDLAVNE